MIQTKIQRTCLPHLLQSMLIPAVMLITLMLTVQACDDFSTGTSSESGTMKVLMHDNIGDYQELWVDIQRVEVNNLADEDTSWVVISEPQERYNLLELINGAHEVLGEAELEAGIYHQIRLILGDDNTIVVNDSTYQLQTPSAQQTGLKLNIDAEIQEDESFILALDFDADRSVVRRGPPQFPDENSYLLKPVIRAYNQATTGSIIGIVDPAESNPWIYAIAGEDTVSSTHSEANTGEFRLLGLPEDTYSVSVNPTEEGFDEVTITDVEVSAETETDLGTIEL